jgi:hypothetical protein
MNDGIALCARLLRGTQSTDFVNRPHPRDDFTE